MSEAFGYFAWVRDQRGGANPEKFHQWRAVANQFPETRKHYERIMVASWPLTREEFDTLSLDELAKRYPCPKRD